ncbi:MAG TPA: ribbon-helix-helix domain-containing protein [Patescibacteria group bacterium]|nr:ribbon-helix-helix domain-containing protein [Patescibacteria group bacterium]
MSTLLNRNVTVAGRRTSMKLEPDMWDALDEICLREQMTAHEVCTTISARHSGNNLTAAMRVFILAYFRASSTELGHHQAGHGQPDEPTPPVRLRSEAHRHLHMDAVAHR